MTDEKVKFSIIVPVYNTANYLRRCLKSLVNQSYHNLEIILINDGSTDESPEICEEYAQFYENVRVIHKKNGGQASARNEGLKNSVGDYISFVDSDDYVSTFLYEKCATIIKNTNADIVCYKLVVGTEENYGFEMKIDDIEVIDGISFLRRAYKYENFDSSVIKVYRKGVFSDVSFPEGRTMGEDAGTIYKLVYKAPKIALTSNVLYYYYQTRDSTMRGHFSIDKVQECDSFKERMFFFRDIGESGLHERALLQYEAVVLKDYYLIAKYSKSEADVKNRLISEINFIKSNIPKLKTVNCIIREVYFIALCFPYAAGRIINKLL